jgi:hypothetical protein
MPPAIQAIIDARTEIEREIDELRRQLEARQDLLAAAARFDMGENGELVVSGGERGTPAARKRELVVSIMNEQPGHPWTTREVRDALAARGIDPQTGTPVKNILWNLAKEGHVHGAGNGVYKLSVLAASAAARQQEAIAV